MTFGEIIGHRAAIDLLQRALRSGHLPHAMLFHGPEGVGKGTVARALAGALLCRDGDADPCGRCGDCLKFAHGSHPDFLVVRRLPRKVEEAGSMADEDSETRGGKTGSELSQFIRIFQIRQLAEHAAFAPREGPVRVFVIDPADHMNAESQNALLKTLEEPPGRSVLILVASRPHLLLPTVRSRCLAVGFAPLAATDLAARLVDRGIPRDEAVTRAALAAGRSGRAIDLDLEALQGRREALMSALKALARSPRALADLAGMTGSLAGGDEEELLEGLDLLEGLLRDASRISAGTPPDSLLHADLADDLADLGRRLGSRRAGRLVEAVERVRGELHFNLNRTLLAESLLAAVAGAPLP